MRDFIKSNTKFDFFSSIFIDIKIFEMIKFKRGFRMMMNKRREEGGWG